MNFTRLSALKSYEEVANVKILDTTDLALHEVAGQLADWIVYHMEALTQLRKKS